MGIQGLFTIIKDNVASHCVTDIVNDSRTRGGIEILVDFYAIMRLVSNLVSIKIAKDFQNQSVLLPIGEYDIYADGVRQFQKAFADCGISLVWYIDGPKGVDEIGSQQKMDVWMEREEKDFLVLEEVLECCRQGYSVVQFDEQRMKMCTEVTIEALKEVGAEIIQLIQGEADDYIAYEFRRRNAYAILANDTDFFVFPECTVMFYQLLHYEYGNQINLPLFDLNNPGKIFKAPTSLRVPIISQQKVLKHFQLSSPSDMLLLGIIRGNDYTKQYADQLQSYLSIRNRPYRFIIPNTLAYMKKNSLKYPAFLSKIRTVPNINPDIMKSVEYSKEFYSLEGIKKKIQEKSIVFDEINTDAPLTSFFARNLSKNQIIRSIYSIHCGNDFDVPYFDCIKDQIYPIVLDERYAAMKKWTYSENQLYEEYPVTHSTIKTHQIHGKHEDHCADEETCGIKIFETIWSVEDTGCLGYFDKFGFEVGVLCCMLRYFFKDTQDDTQDEDLTVTFDEFKALFISVFYMFEKAKGTIFSSDMERTDFLRLQVYPTDQCFLIASRFMSIFYLTKYFVGGALNLTEDVPLARQVMAGSVFYAFYENALPQSERRVSSITSSISAKLSNLALSILEKYHVQFENITS